MRKRTTVFIAGFAACVLVAIAIGASMRGGKAEGPAPNHGVASVTLGSSGAAEAAPQDIQREEAEGEIPTPELPDVAATIAAASRNSTLSRLRRDMNLDIKELPNPPDSVVVARQPAASSKLRYRQVIVSCDENGNPLTTKDSVCMENELSESVVGIDAESGVYTLETASAPFTAIRGENEPVPLSDPRGQTWKETRSFTGKRVLKPGEDIVQGQMPLSGVDPGDYPELAYPEGSVKVGQKWAAVSRNNKNNIAEMEVTGFAEVNGTPCVTLKWTEHTTSSVTVGSGAQATQIQLNVKRAGTRYVDCKRGVVVAEDVVTETGGSAGSALGQRLRLVKQLLKEN